MYVLFVITTIMIIHIIIYKTLCVHDLLFSQWEETMLWHDQRVAVLSLLMVRIDRMELWSPPVMCLNGGVFLM